jgi:kinesin family protein 5
LEIYRETLRDLLNPANSAKLQIREHKKKIWVEHLSEEYVSAAEDVMELIQSGEKLRATSATGMNETSSRSHSVFILRVESRPEGMGGSAARSAVLNLIDLAGSERVGKTGATGQTLKEAQKINQSLSALGNVISALSGASGAASGASGKNAEVHIPYRDSQLTRLLQESLGGNCKTRLVVACSPHAFNFEETLSSLRFGARAKTLRNIIRKNEERSPEELKVGARNFFFFFFLIFL